MTSKMIGQKMRHKQISLDLGWYLSSLVLSFPLSSPLFSSLFPSRGDLWEAIINFNHVQIH